jgi:hypothetical protein
MKVTIWIKITLTLKNRLAFLKLAFSPSRRAKINFLETEWKSALT